MPKSDAVDTIQSRQTSQKKFSDSALVAGMSIDTVAKELLAETATLDEHDVKRILKHYGSPDQISGA